MKTGFNLRPTEDTGVFIDGPNLYGAAKVVGRDIDYRLLRSHFMDNSFTNRIFYYSSILEAGEDQFVTIKPLLDWLSYNGYRVVTKTAREFIDSTGHRKIKGSMIVDMAVDILRAAMNGTKHIVLFSGDGEFTPVLKAVQEMGARTTIVSSKASANGAPMISDELYRQTDNFVDIMNVLDLITRGRETRGAETTSTPRRAAATA